MAIVTALLGFNDLGYSLTPTFLFRNRFYLQLSPHCLKMNKKSMLEVKKISNFRSSGRKILQSCGCKAQETMVAKCELVFYGTSTVNLIHLMGPLKQSLERTFHFKGVIAIFFSLQTLWPYSLKKPDFTDFGCSSGQVLSKTMVSTTNYAKTKSVTLIFFTFLTTLTHHLSIVKFPGNNQC